MHGGGPLSAIAPPSHSSLIALESYAHIGLSYLPMLALNPSTFDMPTPLAPTYLTILLLILSVSPHLRADLRLPTSPYLDHTNSM